MGDANAPLARTAASISAASAGSSASAAMVFSRPWPRLVSLYEYQEPLRTSTPVDSAASTTQPRWLMPLPNMMSNSACRYGGATLFFTTFTLQRMPVCDSAALSGICAILRMSMRTEA